jgi:hypothetical protein
MEVEVGQNLCGNHRHSDLESFEVEAEVAHQREPMMMRNLSAVEAEGRLLLCFSQVVVAGWKEVSCPRTVVGLGACLRMEAGLHAFPLRQASHRLEESF